MLLRHKARQPGTSTAIVPTRQMLPMFEDVALPQSIKSNASVALDIECHEELSELDWMAPLLKGAEVFHIGCNFGLWSMRIAEMSKRVVGYDGNTERAVIAKQMFELNNRGNATAVAELDSDDLALSNVIVVDFRRPMTEEIYLSITQGRAAATVVVLGQCSQNVAMSLLRSGYQHRADLPRAAVFERFDAH